MIGSGIFRVPADVASAVISALVIVSTLGALGATAMSDPRVFFAVARDGNFFASIRKVHARFETPHVALNLAISAAGVPVYFAWKRLRR